MNLAKLEIVSQELAESLPHCHKCEHEAVIYKELSGVPPRPKLYVSCQCEAWDEMVGYPSLYEAVAMWKMKQVLLGEPEPSASSPPIWVNEHTGVSMYWDTHKGAWMEVEPEIPF